MTLYKYEQDAEREKKMSTESIQSRLEKERQRLEKIFEPDPEKKSRILRQRAEKAARAAQLEEKPEKCLGVVSFALGGEKYALEMSYAQEVRVIRQLTDLPQVPGFVLGVINVRGRIISIIDLKFFFDLPRQGLTDNSKAIILKTYNMEFALLADSILGVQQIPLSEIQACLPNLTGIREKYLKGVTKQGLVVLDAQKLLSDPEIIVGSK